MKYEDIKIKMLKRIFRQRKKEATGQRSSHTKELHNLYY
jgi:hypothetical protein